MADYTFPDYAARVLLRERARGDVFVQLRFARALLSSVNVALLLRRIPEDLQRYFSRAR